MCVSRALAQTIYEFCRTGLVNDNTWSTLRPREAELRDMSIVDVRNVWLGENWRAPEALKRGLLALGCREPFCVSVIESLTEGEAYVTRETHQGFTTPNPKVYQGLLSALGANKRSQDCDCLSSNAPMMGAYTTSTSVPRNKRPNVNRVIPEVAQRVHHADVAANGLVHMKQLSGALDKGLTSSLGSSGISSNETAPEIYPDGLNHNHNTSRVYWLMDTGNVPKADIWTDLHLTANTTTLDAFFTSAQGETTRNQGRADDTSVFFLQGSNDVDSEVSGVQSDNSNANETQVDDNQDSPDVSTMLFDCFRYAYDNDACTLNRVLDEVRAKFDDNYSGDTLSNQPQPRNQSESNVPQHHHQVQCHLERQQLQHHETLDPYQVALLVAARQSVEEDGDREAGVYEK